MSKKYGTRTERRLAKKLGGFVQPASGALPHQSAKADIRKRSSFRVESKSTKKDFITLKATWFDKLLQQTRWDEVPVLSLTISGTRFHLVLEECDSPSRLVLHKSHKVTRQLLQKLDCIEVDQVTWAVHPDTPEFD